jgi:hypothetical protein
MTGGYDRRMTDEPRSTPRDEAELTLVELRDLSDATTDPEVLRRRASQLARYLSLSGRSVEEHLDRAELAFARVRAGARGPAGWNGAPGARPPGASR